MHFSKALLAPYQNEQFSLAYAFENKKMGQLNRISAQDSKPMELTEKSKKCWNT